jgi:uncharacterized protein (DUF1800 family)
MKTTRHRLSSLLSNTGAIALSVGLLASPAMVQQATAELLMVSQTSGTTSTFEAPFAGTYLFRVPAVAGATVILNDQVLVQVTDTLPDETVSALTMLNAGSHEVVVEGLSASQGALQIEAAGGMSVALAPVETDPDPVVEVAAKQDEPASPAPPPLPPETRMAGASQTSGALLSSLSSNSTAGNTVAQGERRVATGTGSGPRSGTLRDAVGTLPGADRAAPVISAPLSPPAGEPPVTGLVLTYAGDTNGRVPNTGVTLFGVMGSEMIFDQVEVTVLPSGRQFTVDVGPQTGQFAVPLFQGDLNRSSITVRLAGRVSSDSEATGAETSIQIYPRPLNPGAMQAMSRLTFGPTPALHARLQTMSFADFVEEQLNPDLLDDSALEAFAGDLVIANNGDSDFRVERDWERYELAHAIYTERQLQEVMGRFWFNHFHANTKDTGVRYQRLADREFFRENAFGNFEDLLLYSAKSPLMSQYLDNDESRAGAINENYGREILELHTVGVGSGYTLDDIIAVARVLTGWDWERTVDVADSNARDRHEFLFRPDRHDQDDKFIPFLNTTIAGRSGEAGVQEGEELIALLANHPSTRTFVCSKIVRLLAADQPPESLVQACAAAWEETGGEIEPMLRAILLHPDYLDLVDLRRTKVKTPFEYVVSLTRSLGIRPSDEERNDYLQQLLNAHTEAGESQARFPAPTGLPEVGSAWTNSATFIALYRRMVDIMRNPQRFDHEPSTLLDDAGLETAEEVAAFMLLGTMGHATQEEFEAVVAALKGDDGIFDRFNENERDGIRRGLTAVAITPSMHLQ